MKKIMTFVLLICMLMTIAACAATTPTTIAPTTAATTKMTDQTTATTMGPVEPVTLTAFVTHTWYPIDTFTGFIAEQITKDTGITLDLQIATDDKQLGVLIASGDLPDLVYTDGQLDTLSDAKLCYDYDELIEKFNVDWEIDPVLRSNSQLYSTDGKIYMIRNHCPTPDEWANASIGAPMTGSLSIRQDILDKLGNPKLDTLADLEAIYGMVKTQFPDLVPLEINRNWRFNVLKIWSGVSLLNWIKQADGSYKYVANTQTYYDFFKMMNRWFNKGYMVADNFADSAEFKLYGVNKAFSYSICTQNGNVGQDSELKAIDPSFNSVELKPLDNKVYATSDIGWSGTFISRSCSNPEAAIKYMQYLFTPYAQKLCQMGREGVDYKLDANNVPIYSQEWIDAVKDNTFVNKWNPWLYFGGSETAEAIGRCASLPDYSTVYEPVYKEIREGYVNYPWLNAAEPKGTSEEKIAFTKIVDLIKPFEAKLTMAASDAEFEAQYAEFIKAMKASGLEMLEAYMNKMIPEMEAKYK